MLWAKISRWVVGVSVSCHVMGFVQEHPEGSGVGPLVVTHPLTNSIKLIAKDISVNFPRPLFSGFIDLLLLSADFLLPFLPELPVSKVIQEGLCETGQRKKEGQKAKHQDLDFRVKMPARTSMTL